MARPRAPRRWSSQILQLSFTLWKKGRVELEKAQPPLKLVSLREGCTGLSRRGNWAQRLRGQILKGSQMEPRMASEASGSWGDDWPIVSRTQVTLAGKPLLKHTGAQDNSHEDCQKQEQGNSSCLEPPVPSLDLIMTGSGSERGTGSSFSQLVSSVTLAKSHKL